MISVCPKDATVSSLFCSFTLLQCNSLAFFSASCCWRLVNHQHPLAPRVTALVAGVLFFTHFSAAHFPSGSAFHECEERVTPFSARASSLPHSSFLLSFFLSFYTAPCCTTRSPLHLYGAPKGFLYGTWYGTGGTDSLLGYTVSTHTPHKSRDKEEIPIPFHIRKPTIWR